MSCAEVLASAQVSFWTPPNFVVLFRKKSAQVSRNFRAVTTCGQRHHKFELLFPQLFERGVRLRRPRPARSRGARPVGRSGTGTLLAAYCERHTGAERRYVGGYSIWMHGSATRNETRKFLESMPLSFLRAGPPKFRRLSIESRTHPNFKKKSGVRCFSLPLRSGP